MTHVLNDIHFNLCNIFQIPWSCLISGSWGLERTWCRRFGDLEQDGPRFHVTDLEPGEVDHVDIFFWGAKIVWKREKKLVKLCFQTNSLCLLFSVMELWMKQTSHVRKQVVNSSFTPVVQGQVTGTASLLCLCLSWSHLHLLKLEQCFLLLIADTSW